MITIAFYGIKDIYHPFTSNHHYNASHDHNITILKDGQLLYFIELERYTRIKHDCRLDEFLEEIIEKCVPNYQNEEIVLISVNSFLGNSFISKFGRIRIEPKCRIRVEDIISDASVQFYTNGLNRIESLKGFIMTHEFAHIATCLPFFGKFHPESLLVHIDGGAYESSSSVWYYDGSQINCLDYGWEELKDVVNNYNVNPLSFFILGESSVNHLSLPGKLMGYSSYGVVKQDMIEWLRNNQYFLQFEGTHDEMLALINAKFKLSLQGFDNKHQIFMDIAACIQSEFENQIVEFINRYKIKTGAKFLYYSGGAALNIKTNSIIENTCGFNKIFIPPCCSDSGLSLGAAYYYEFLLNNQIQRVTPYINNFFVEGNNKSENNFALAKICSEIAKGKVFGICVGAAEAGPRALGHRSIIARADSIQIRKKVSEQIKGREWYRPIAPIIVDYLGQDVIEENILDSTLSKYMLGNYHLKKEFWGDFKGVIHIDGSVRAQIIYADEPETSFIYKILTKLDKDYGIKGLINTSFNIKGKPIVHSFVNSIEEGKKMGLDGVIHYEKLYQF